jgi:predicted phage-related endonuclease
MFIDLPEHTPAWHAMRAGKIGGSDIAGLFGAQPDWGAGEYELYHVKSGNVPPKKFVSGRAQWGTQFEPTIAHAAAKARGWKIVKGRYAVDDTTAGMGASLDYEVMDPGADVDGVSLGPILFDGDEIGRVMRPILGPLMGPGMMQVKQVDYGHYKREWIGGEPPAYVLLQVQHELACSGYTWAVIAALLGNNDLRLYFYEPRPKVIENIRTRVTRFWQRVKDKDPPPIDGSEGAERVVKELFPVLADNENDPLDLTGDNELPTICADLISASANRLSFEKEEKRLKNRIREKMGIHTFAFTTGFVLKCQVTPEKKPRKADPGEMIGGRAEARKYIVTEDLAA